MRHLAVPCPPRRPERASDEPQHPEQADHTQLPQHLELEVVGHVGMLDWVVDRRVLLPGGEERGLPDAQERPLLEDPLRDLPGLQAALHRDVLLEGADGLVALPEGMGREQQHAGRGDQRDPGGDRLALGHESPDEHRGEKAQRSSARVRRDDPHQDCGDAAGSEDAPPEPRPVRGEVEQDRHRPDQRHAVVVRVGHHPQPAAAEAFHEQLVVPPVPERPPTRDDGCGRIDEQRHPDPPRRRDRVHHRDEEEEVLGHFQRAVDGECAIDRPCR